MVTVISLGSCIYTIEREGNIQCDGSSGTSPICEVGLASSVASQSIGARSGDGSNVGGRQSGCSCTTG